MRTRCWFPLWAIGYLAATPHTWAEEGFRCAGQEARPAAVAAAAKAAVQFVQPSTGHINALVVYAGFSDEAAAEPFAPADAAGLFDPRREGSFTHFYATMSFDQLNVTGTVLPRRYGAASRANAYVNPDPGRRGDFGQYVTEVLQQVDSAVDFRQYDNDGPDGIPDSGDDDGVVDYVFIVAHTTPAGFLTGHATGIASLGFAQGIETADVGHDGLPIRLISDGSHGCLVAEGNFVQTVGAMAHEFGHALGLPDLYDLTYTDPAEDSAGIGRWGLMGWGAHGWSGGGGPEPFCPWSLEQLGWLGRNNERLVEVTTRQTALVARDLFQGGNVYKVHLPAPFQATPGLSNATPTAEPSYLLLEWRTRQGSPYSRDLPGEGLLVWQVRPQQTQNSDEYDKLVDLVCADGLREDGQDDLDRWAHDDAWTAAHQGNQGDANDPFDGVRRTELSLTSNPSVDSLGTFGESALTPLSVRVRRQGNEATLSIDPPRWAGTIVGPVYWAGVVLVDGDLTVAPDGSLVLSPGTEVRIAPTDRLRSGADPGQCEVRVQGSLRVISLVHTPSILRSQLPGSPWYGVVLEPAEAGVVYVPDGSLTLEDAAHGIALSGAPEGVSGLVLDGIELSDAVQDGAAGNGDGLLQPGESVQVTIELSNWSLMPLKQVQVVARWDDPRLTTTWSSASGSSSQTTQTVTVNPGESRRVALPQLLTLSPEARPGEALSLQVEVNTGHGVQRSEAKMAVASGSTLPVVRFLAGGHPADSLLVAAAGEVLPLRLEAPQGGVAQVEAVVYDRNHQQVTTAVPLSPQDRGGTAFTGAIDLPLSSLELVARVHTEQGAVFLAPSRVRVEVPVERWEPVLVVWSSALQKSLGPTLTGMLDARGLTANQLDPATAGSFGEALLQHYQGTGRMALILVAGQYLSTSPVLPAFLQGGGRLLLAGRPYGSSWANPDSRLLGLLGAGTLSSQRSALRLADGSDSLPGSLAHGVLTGLSEGAEPVMLDEGGNVAGVRLDAGAYRSVYLPFDLSTLAVATTALEQAVDFLRAEPASRHLAIGSILGLDPVMSRNPARPRVVLTNSGEQAIGPVTVNEEILADGATVARYQGKVTAVPAGQSRTAWMPLWTPAEERDYRLRYTVTDGRGQVADPFEQTVRVAAVAGRFEETALPSPTLGNGVAAFDADGDTDLDLLVVRQGAPNLLLRHDGGTWHEMAAEAGVAGQGDGRGVAVGDWDADGDLDLYLVNSPTGASYGANRLLANQGDGHFVDVTAAVDSASAGAAVLADPGAGRSAGFLDYDGDGDLDLYLVNAYSIRFSANRLFRNDQGRFAEVAESLGVADEANGRGLAIGDYDRDGDPDLFVVSRLGSTGSELYRNEVDQGRGFVAVGATAGLTPASRAVAAAWGDADGDGDLDLFVADEAGPGQYWRNEGPRDTAGNPDSSSGRFTLVDSTQGAPSPTKIVGVTWADYDNDGDLDLLTTGLDPQSGEDEVWQNRGSAGFLAVGSLLGLRRGSEGRGLVTADLDGDGRLDLLVADLQHTTLYANRVNPASWLELALRTTGANRDAVGARVELYAQGQRQVRWQQPAVGYASQGSPWLHFGLGSAARVDSLRVWWPDGTQSLHRNLRTGQRLILVQPRVAALAGKPVAIAPERDALLPPYPNPFNASTTIGFTLARPQTVELTVYNALGQRIRLLTTGALEAGTHQLVWDGTDEEGRASASGVYLCRLAGSHWQQTRRMLLLR